ncbi:pentapeptide repeat-containing protein [Scytonema sp. PCC 10023]|uniref:nSTAND1 domain-containing NTPase n=1 Tax=Scytonema sp. PCC 10023 TaxID=1680591 RepID=UPI0039C616FF
MSRDALVVGINTYSYERLSNLTAPAQDAEAIATLLQDYGEFNVKRLPGVKDKQNNTIRVGQKTQVSLTQLEEAIVQLFKPEGKNIPDTALLYFSGHGLRKNKGIQEGFLATSDVNPDLGNWGIRLKWLRELMQESPIRQQIIWLDCCYSGELLDFAEADPGDRGKGRDRCFIAASREFEVAYETISSNHSVLTDALLQALDPKRNSGIWVTNYTIIDVLNQRLQAFPQRPLFANSGGAINLTRTWQAPPVEESHAIETSICPYRGLAYFDWKEEDAKYFYGREALTDQLLEKVRAGNFLAVLGASGSGKSSVVRAGLLYQLTLGRRLSGSDTWRIRIFQPGDHPLKTLTVAFLDSGLSDIERASQLAKAEELIAKGAVGLGQLINAANTKRVVLVADQFEEAFTLCKDITERQQFFECLLGALERTGDKLCLVLTMRADFFGKCAEQEYSGLAQQIQQNLVTVTPMNSEELKRAIEIPAKLVELKIEPQLVSQMLADVENAPGSLPLLQYTLTELWKQRTDNCLRVNIYAQLGGVMGTLRKRATEVYNSFPEQQQATVRYIFLSLTQLGEGTEDTRRRILKQDLVNARYPEELINEVVQRLADEKLIVTTEMVAKRGETQRVAVVDVAHEALIRHWSLLREWLDENREILRQKRKIEVAAQEWLDKGKRKDYLFPGLRLAEAKDFQEKHADSFPLSSLAEEFLFESEINPSKASIQKIHIQDSDLINSIFNEVQINSFHFSTGSFTGVTFANTNINSAYFDEVDLTRVNFINTNFINTHIEKSDLTGITLIGSKLIRAYIEQGEQAFQNSEVNLSGCDLRNVNLSGCHLCGSILTQANLSNANLCEINLIGTDLSSSDLSKVNLNKANLSGANLSQVNLSGANLSDSNLCGANLDDSNLSTANFSGAKLIGAKFNGANLQFSELNDADIMACDFNGAINLTTRQIKVAKNWQYAQYDEDFRKELGLASDTE